MKKTRLPAVVVALGFVSLFTDVASDMIVPVLPAFLTQTLGAGPVWVGLIDGAAELVAALFKALGGMWSDLSRLRYGWVVAGYGLSSLVRPFIGAAAAPLHVLLLRCLDRVGKGLRTAPRDAMLTAVVEQGRRGHAFGFHRAMDHAGALIGGLVAAGLLAIGVSMRGVIAWSVLPGVLAMIVVLGFVRERRPEDCPAGGSEQGEAQDAGRLSGPLRRFLLVASFFTLANSSDAFLLLKAGAVGLPVHRLPLLWAWIHVVRVVANLWGGRLSDRFGAKRSVAAGWALYGVVYLLVALVAQEWQMWLVCGLYGFYSGLTEGGEKSLVASLAGLRGRGRAFGAYHACTGLAALPASLLTGWIWQAAGPAPAFATCAVVAMAAALALACSRTGRSTEEGG